MRLSNILATPHPYGNQIELSWVNPDPTQYPGVRVMRREGSHPTTPYDGDLITEGLNLHYDLNDFGEGLHEFLDEGPLKGETVYYYALFPYASDPPDYVVDRNNRTAAMATAVYNLAERMAELLPAIYHRYDAANSQALRRFLDLPGGQLNQSYSFIRSLLDLYNLERVDGRLLPLLAQWIGWNTDNRLEIETQRNEVRQATAVYKSVGIIPTVETVVKRISNWESRTKEFVHNVFLSNRPERLNIWARLRDSVGGWDEPTNPLSLDFAYEGRPTAVRDVDGVLWLFYHTLSGGRWNIWFKTLSTFDMDLALQIDLDNNTISTALIAAFAAAGFILSPLAIVETVGDEWVIHDDEYDETYRIRVDAGRLHVYRWTPSVPLTNAATQDKHPAATLQDDILWLFWDVYDEVTNTWRIDFRTQSGAVWSPLQTFVLPLPNPQPERKRPFAVTDNTGGLWLFWLEKAGIRWSLNYNRHNGVSWESGAGEAFPLTPIGENPRVEEDLFVLFHPTAATLWVFWARQEATTDPDQTHWSITYRTKASLDLTLDDWSDISVMPKIDADDHDREPSAILDGADNIELFWSGNRDGSWSIRRNTLDIVADSWGTAEAITEPPYSQRAPLPLTSEGGLLLIYRANDSLAYQSQIYQATETKDFRYAGATTVHTRNADKIALRREFDDFQSYTYDTGPAGQRRDDDWYSRDTIGLYLAPDTVDAEKINNGVKRIERVLAEFMPLTDRAVYITQSDLHTEHVYTYGLPGAPEPVFIGESFNDVLISTLAGGALGPGEDFSDDLE